MKKVILAMLLAMMPLAANADWVAGFGYYNLSDDEGGIDVSLGALVASIGYRYESESEFTFMPELRVGIGAGDDTVLGVKVELDSVIALSVRGQYDFESGVYLFGYPSYANVDLKASSGGMSVSADDWEFGFGAGFGFPFSDNVSGELTYETYDDTDVIGASVKIGFK